MNVKKEIIIYLLPWNVAPLFHNCIHSPFLARQMPQKPVRPDVLHLSFRRKAVTFGMLTKIENLVGHDRVTLENNLYRIKHITDSSPLLCIM
jgi:hypothetical protein